MKKKRTYTIKMHIYRAKMMLKSKHYVVKACCPAASATPDDHFGHFSVTRNRELWGSEPCPICRHCADIDHGCACIILGEKEAKRRLFKHENLQRKV